MPYLYASIAVLAGFAITYALITRHQRAYAARQRRLGRMLDRHRGPAFVRSCRH